MTGRWPRPLGAVLASIGVLFAATAVLTSIHHEESTARVRGHLEAGQQLAAAGDVATALAEFRAALALERGNEAAVRALATGLLSVGRYAEAETYLTDLLAVHPTDGALNRSMARIDAASGRHTDARAAYQRAIYGEWRKGAEGGRIETRFELFEYLMRLDAREEALAELVRLKAELPVTETAAQRRVADLLVKADAANIAIDGLQRAAAAAPRDVELLAQLADTQARTGHTVEARATLRRALAVDPNRQSLQDRLAVIDLVLTLDPTLPRLRLITRTGRARQVLQAVFTESRACADAAAPAVLAVQEEVAHRLERRARSDARWAEDELDLAVRLWSAVPACHGSSPVARALDQVLRRIQTAQDLAP